MRGFSGRFSRLCWSVGMSEGDCLDSIHNCGETHFSYVLLIPRAGTLDCVNGESVKSTTLPGLSGFSNC